MIGPPEIIVRLFLGALIGGVIGFERQTHGRPAGFRTHLLVCVASVLIMIVSEYYHYLSLVDPSYVRVDPARLAAGAVTGVGFLGAGVIVKTGMTVQGLTTAACLWIVSAIGLAIGSGLYFAAVMSFVITYLTLWTLRMFERKMSRTEYRFMTITMRGTGDEEMITSVLQKHKAHINRINYERDLEKDTSLFELTFSFTEPLSVRKILDDISAIDAVKRVIIKS